MEYVRTEMQMQRNEANSENGPPPEYLTLQEVGELLRLSESSVKRLVKSGRLPVIDVGAGKQRNLRVRADRIDEALAVSPPVSKPKPVRRRRLPPVENLV